MILPRRHAPKYFAMTGQERAEAEDLLRHIRNRLLRDKPGRTSAITARGISGM